MTTGGSLPTYRRLLRRLGALMTALIVLLGAPVSAGTEDEADTVPPTRSVDAESVAVAVNAESGEAVLVNFTINTSGLDAGVIFAAGDVGGGRHLATVRSDDQRTSQLDDARLEWRCDAATCSIAATMRIEVFTEVGGEYFINASGGTITGDPAPDATIGILADDATTERASVYELEYTLREYPDDADQAPHSGLDFVEYDLGDPSDPIQLVLRPLLGNVSLDSPASLDPPTWAANLIPVADTSSCPGACSGTAIVRVGPSDFSNLEYQLLAYSDRPGVAATAAATTTAASVVTEIGFVTMTADRPVAAIPITVEGDLENTRIMADVGVRGRDSFATLRAVGSSSFEPALQWIAPSADVEQYELAISSPGTQLGDIEISWAISLYKLPDSGEATIEVGDPQLGSFAAGQPGDPDIFPVLNTPDGEGGSALPWILGGGIVVAAAAGGLAMRRKRARA